MYKLQSIHPKQNQNQIMHESNKLCMLQTGIKSPWKCRSPWVLNEEKFHFVRTLSVNKLSTVTYISNKMRSFLQNKIIFICLFFQHNFLFLQRIYLSASIITFYRTKDQWQFLKDKLTVTLNPLHATGLFLYASWKDQETFGFPMCFRKYRKRPVARNGLRWLAWLI